MSGSPRAQQAGASSSADSQVNQEANATITAVNLTMLCNDYVNNLVVLQELAEGNQFGQAFLTEMVSTSEECHTQLMEANNKVNRAIAWFNCLLRPKENKSPVGQDVEPRQPRQPQPCQPQGASAVDIQDTAQRNRKAMVSTAESAEEIVQSIPEVIVFFLQICF